MNFVFAQPTITTGMLFLNKLHPKDYSERQATVAFFPAYTDLNNRPTSNKNFTV